MQRYDKYKDSGVEWLGEIPEKWEVKKLKHLVLKVGSGVTPKGGASAYEKDGIPLLRSQNVHFDGLRLDDVAYISQETHDSMSGSKVNTGDVLVNITGGSIGRCFYISEGLGEFNVNQHVCIIRPSGQIHTKYLYWVMRSETVGQEQINIEQTGSGREGLNFEALKNFTLPVLVKDEQIKIANYLEQKTAEIDNLIKQKEQLIALYQEEKAVLINQAVTKGLNPNVEMKDSGIEWLGEIPEGWQLKKLKHLIDKLESGVSVNSLDGAATVGNVGILKTSCVYHYEFDAKENKEILPSELSRAKVSPRKGGIIISRMNTPELVGASGYVEEDYPDLFLPDRLWQTILFNDIEINSKWLAQILKSISFRKYLSILATGTSPSMKNLGQEEFLNIGVPFMEINEQNAIVEYIDIETKRIDKKISNNQRIIELQKEYRTALISEAVTGKFKVPELVEKEFN